MRVSDPSAWLSIIRVLFSLGHRCDSATEVCHTSFLFSLLYPLHFSFLPWAEGFTCIQQDGLLDLSLCPRAAFAWDSNGDSDSQCVLRPAHLRVLDPQPCGTYNCICTGLGLPLTPLGNSRVVGRPGRAFTNLQIHKFLYIALRGLQSPDHGQVESKITYYCWWPRTPGDACRRQRDAACTTQGL